jgi:hypothetical protein
MSEPRSAVHRFVLSAAALTLAGLLLASCGGKGSSSGTTGAAGSTAGAAGSTTGAVRGTAGGSRSTTGAARGTSTSATASPSTSAAISTRQARLRACMKRFGIAPPSARAHKAGEHASGALGVEGGPQLPPGVSRGRFDRALERCGARSSGGASPASGRFNSPEFRAALGRFAVCLRRNGVDIPPPRVSGSGPVFTTKGLKTGSPGFLKAERSCSPILAAAFRHASSSNSLGKAPAKKQ